ncbi:MAG: hypothetical protein QXS16_03375 [Pyrobaculum sp.]
MLQLSVWGKGGCAAFAKWLKTRSSGLGGRLESPYLYDVKSRVWNA